MYRLVLLLLVCLLLPSAATAQDSTELQCSESDISATIDSALAGLQEAKSQEPSAALASIDEVRQELAALNSQCLGLTFSGTAGTVHGPVVVPEGIYRIVVNGQRVFTMSSTVLEGECSHGMFDEIYIFNEIEMSVEEFTVEKVFKSEGCSVLFETSSIGGPYTVTFEKLK